MFANPLTWRVRWPRPTRFPLFSLGFKVPWSPSGHSGRLVNSLSPTWGMWIQLHHGLCNRAWKAMNGHSRKLAKLSMTIFSKFWSQDRYPICIHGSRLCCFTCIAEQVTSEVVDVFLGARGPWSVISWTQAYKWPNFSIQLRRHCFIIRPSLDGTYYGMALSVRPSVRPTVSTKKHRCKWRIFFKFCTQVCLGVPSINLLFVLSYLIKYAHNSIISDFSILGIPRVIF